MGKKVLLVNLFRIIIFIVSVIVLLWPILPLGFSKGDIVLCNQTIRIFTGLSLLLLALIGLIASAPGRIIAFITGICAVLLIGDCFAFLPRSSVNHPLAGHQFTILSLNIFHRGPPPDSLFETIEEYSPDLIFLQEIGKQRWEETRLPIEEMGYRSFPIVYEAPYSAVGTVVFSRLPVRSSRKYFLPSIDWFPEWPLQYLQFKVGGEWIQCFNIHLIPPHPSHKSYYPCGIHWDIAFQQLEKIVSIANERDLPTIIIGDYNMTPNHRLKKIMNGKFKSAWTAAGEGFGFSFPAELPLFHIDDLYFSRQLSACCAELFDADYSDHKGLIFKMSLNEK